MTTNPTAGIATVLTAAEQGATVITANNRSAGALLDAYALGQRERGANAWRTPDIVSWSGFVLRLWNEAMYGGLCGNAVLLNSSQEQHMWQRIVSADAKALLNPAATAEAAERAWELVRRYAVPLSSPLYQTRPESAAFAKWATAFEKECRRNGWLDRASLADALAGHVRAGRLRAPKRIVLVGFDEITPQQEAFLDALSETGARYESVAQLRPREGTACVVEAQDEDDEIRVAATWARTKIKANADARIAIVVPSLGDLRSRIEAIFLATQHPEQMPCGASDRRRAFELSLGIALGEHPVIATALLVLKLCTGRLSLAEAGALLRSPFLAGADAEMTERAQLDAVLRKKRALEVTLEILRDAAFHRCSVLYAALRDLGRLLDSIPETMSPRQWSESAAEMLKAVSWPEGERGLSSEEYQAVEGWTKLLSEFGSLDAIEPTMNAAQFYRRINECATRVTFEPEKLGAPIQIMGLLEAAGSAFDSMWVMGLHDGAWPARAAATPFIPLELQLQHDVPHASSEMEVQFAEAVCDRLLRSAGEIVFSFPRKEGDMLLRPSPLLGGFERKPLEEISGEPTSSWGDVLAGSCESESICDEMGPAIAAGTLVKGGTKVLEMQSACPFRAFAELRLGATEMDSPQAGLDNMQRGDIVHKAMEFIWKRLKTRDELLKCEALGELVDECVGQAIEAARISRNTEWEQRLTEIERDRVKGLILELLELDKQRAPFKVAEEEQKRQIVFGELQLDVRVDRIDRIEDGRQVVVDYKTGEVKVNSWEGHRPEQPQLPAYAAAMTGEIAAVTFAQVKAGAVGYRGYSPESAVVDAGDYSKTLPGKLGEALPSVVLRWKNTVERLAREHREGRAKVDPAKPPETCKYCPLPALCRISQSDLVQHDEVLGDEE